jgi:putative RNA 2'-phosphotransferase
MAEPLTRILALALRHKPELFGIAVDNQGWADLERLSAGLCAHFPALPAAADQIREFVAGDIVERFEIEGERIRALYGHSLQHVIVGELAEPPALLYHATRAVLLPRIREHGLLAKGRNGVHLTTRWDYAVSVRDTHSQAGQRGVILAVETEKTRFKGIVFYRATEHVWLSPYIPASYLAFVSIEPTTRVGSRPPGTLVPLDNMYNRAIVQARLSELCEAETGD